MAEFNKRVDKDKRIIPAGFMQTCESGVDIVGKAPALARQFSGVGFFFEEDL